MNPVLSYQPIAEIGVPFPDLPPAVATAPVHSAPAVMPGGYAPTPARTPPAAPTPVPATMRTHGPATVPIPVHSAPAVTPAYCAVPIDRLVDRLIDDPAPQRAAPTCIRRHDVAVLDTISFALAHMRQFGGCLALGAGALVECALGLLPVASPSPDLLFSVGLALTACPAALITARYCAVRLGCRQPRPAG